MLMADFFHSLTWLSLYPLRLKSRGVVSVVEDEFQSPPSPTIHYTCNDTLEGLRYCELPESVSTHTIWVQKVGLGKAKFVPTHKQKIGCGKDFSAHTPISTMSNHSLYLWREIRRFEMLWNDWISLHTTNVGVKHRDPEQKISATRDSKSRVWW